MAEMARIVGFNLLNDDTTDNLAERTADLHNRISGLAGSEGDVDLLGRIPKNKRRIYQEVFDLVYECSNNRANAKVLIDKILAKVST